MLPFDRFSKHGRSVDPRFAVPAIAASAAFVLAVTTHAAGASLAFETALQAVTCATTAACVSGKNSASGAGVSGVSATGIGVSGAAANGNAVQGIAKSGNGVSGSASDGVGVIGFSAAGQGGVVGLSKGSDGVLGYTTSGSGNGVEGDSTTSNGVIGRSTGGIGVAGVSQSYDAVQGFSEKGFGVRGISSGAYGVIGYSVNGTAGVNGYTPSTYGVYGYTTSGTGVGVVGASTTGVGVVGSSGSGQAVYGTTTSGTGLYGVSSNGHGVGGFAVSNSAVGVYGSAITSYGVYGTTSSGDGYGVLGNVTGAGIGVYGGSPNGYGLEGQSANFPLVLKNGGGTTVFDVDSSGNVAFKGNIEALARTPGGLTATAFSARTTQPTIEDTGTARLVNGSAVVELDPAFSATIDRAARYRVFLTPDGETHELYVANKTPSSFTVREAQGGRSTVDVDYRIVASVAGESGTRMSLARASGPSAPRVPAALVVAPLAVKSTAPLPR